MTWRFLHMIFASRAARRAKVVMDRVAGVAGLVIVAPVLGPAAIAVRIGLGRPIFFVQERPGLRGRPFKLVKLRTMRDVRDETGMLLPDNQRMTRLGKILRSASIDELPQLWNVAKGELSLVGPRPLLMEYLERYTSEQARRHSVRPGITGWAQVNGRNSLSWEEKFALDVWYVDNWSLLLDLKILAKTAHQVLKREGISQAGSATMPEFMGSEKGCAEAGQEG
jgi:sugar transferase EpsL